MDQHSVHKRTVLNALLVCPLCRNGLKDDENQYICMRCDRTYPIRDHIPRFLVDLSNAEHQVKRSFNVEHARYLESRHLHFTSRLVEQWLEDVQLPPEYFKGKLILDAGCGSGRWTYAMASLGATVVAVDLTDAGVAVTHNATAVMENVVVLQANVLHLPFRPDSFDFVVSWGVLHHTPNTKAAFERLVPLVKKGGQLYVMVYEKHNPLKFFCTDLIRWFLRKLPEEQRYRSCKLFIIKNRRLGYLLTHLMVCAFHPEVDDPLEISTRQLGLYDAYAPVFNHLHTREEIASWFRDCNFDQVTLTKPVRYTKKMDILLFGECDGSVNMRGIQT